MLESGQNKKRRANARLSKRTLVGLVLGLGLDSDLHVSGSLLSGFLVLNGVKLNAADVDVIVGGHLGSNILLTLIGILGKRRRATAGRSDPWLH